MNSLVSSLRNWKSDYAAPDGRTGELFRANLSRIQTYTDKLFYYLFLIQYPAMIVLALVRSPLSWAGQHSSIHFHVWMAIVFGGLLASLPVFLIRVASGTVATRQVIAAAQMLSGSLLIHLSGGRIETHFHIFGSLAFLSFYRDVRILSVATGIAAADHLLRGIFYPESVYGMAFVSSWRFVEHAFWMIFEDIFLFMACAQSRAQLTAMSAQQAQLEQWNENMEAAVRARTSELSQRTQELEAARDAAMESTRLKSQFLANVSHEIRTPMNGVLGMTSILLESDLNHEQRDCALIVQRSAEGLLTIINDILDFSKIEAGKLQLEFAPLQPAAEVDNVIRMLADAAERKRLELEYEIDASVPHLVSGDAGRLRQILVNLVANAIKFTDEGRVFVHVRELERTESISLQRFEISDTGVGISEPALNRLFRAFVQVDGTSTRKHEGTGLGLAISKELIELMGGRIGVDSTPGVGTTFWFEVAFTALDDAPGTSEKWGALQGLRVLIVDDPAVAPSPVVARTLEGWKVDVERVSGGDKAWERLEYARRRAEAFDLLILDGGIPEVAGVPIPAAIRKKGGNQKPKLLLLTSLQQCPLDRTGDGGESPEGRLVKPIGRQDLFVTIARLCGRNAESGRRPGSTLADSGVPPLQRPLRILVAEDNIVNQRVLVRMLEILGQSCDLVNDGQAAVDAVARQTFDVVLMDCQMPILDGIGAATAIRGLPEPSCGVPITAVTANAMSGDRERCVAGGMTHYLSKPIRLVELARLLHQIEVEANAGRPEPAPVRS